MESGHGIGAMSRSSGLTISALRFYDGAGVLRPDRVDPRTGPDLARALRAVRFAVGTDPGLPMLGGVLLDVTANAVTTVATDRHRLAVASAAAMSVEGPAMGCARPGHVRRPAARPLPGPGDDHRRRWHRRGPVSRRVVEGTPLDEQFPDYRRLLPSTGAAVPVDALQIRVAGRRTVRRDGVDHEVVVLSRDAGGGLRIGGDGVAVNVEFLLEALDAGGPGQLLLGLDGPLTPLVVRSQGSLSLLMPVRLDG